MKDETDRSKAENQLILIIYLKDTIHEAATISLSRQSDRKREI